MLHATLCQKLLSRILITERKTGTSDNQPDVPVLVRDNRHITKTKAHGIDLSQEY